MFFFLFFSNIFDGIEELVVKWLNLRIRRGCVLALERVDNIHGRDRLSASVLGVGDGVTDDVLEEHLENSAGLLVDQTGDALDTTSASQSANRGLGNSLDIIAKNLAMTLGASLSESLSSFSTSRHV